jgi:hypothetical protein
MNQKTFISHPLESVFDMDEGTVDIGAEYAAVEVAPAPQNGPVEDHKDEDDKLIEARIDDVYDQAITAFKNQTAYMEIIEPRYAARNAEVAANYLNIALAAANSRAKVKTDRKKSNQFIPFNGGKTTNNVIVANREDVLKMLQIDADKKNF